MFNIKGALKSFYQWKINSSCFLPRNCKGNSDFNVLINVKYAEPATITVFQWTISLESETSEGKVRVPSPSQMSIHPAYNHN